MSWKKYRLCPLLVLLMLFALMSPAQAAVLEWTDLGAVGGGDPIWVGDTAIHIIDGIPYAAYTDDANNVVVKKYDAGLWTPVVAFTDGTSFGNVYVSLDASGSTLYLAYSSNSGYTAVKSLDTATPGAPWINLSTTEVPAVYTVDMCVDGSNIYLGLRSESAAVAVYNGSSWKITTLADYTCNGLVTVTILNGTPYVAYHDDKDGAYRTGLAKYEGGAWSDLEGISGFDSPHGLASLDGKLVLLTLVYDYDTQYRFLHVDLIDPANGINVVPLSGISSDIYDGETSDADLLVDKGMVYVSYVPGGTGSTPDGKIRLKYFSGAEWEQVGPEMIYIGGSPSMAVDSGEFYVSFINNDNSSAWVQRITPALSLSAPTVAVQPTDQTVTETLTAEFTAAASGVPMPMVQWQMSLDNGNTWNNIAGATANTFSITAALADNKNQYRAVFTNSEGSATSAAALLTVNAYVAAPQITDQPYNQTVSEGQIAMFSAYAEGTPTPTVQWQKSTDNGGTWSDIAEATATTLSFTAAIADDGTQYRAVFTNSVGTVTSDASILTVEPPGIAPDIILQPVNQTVTEGETAQFTAAANGTPEPAVQWQVLTVGGAWSDISGATETTLSFTAALADSGNQYRAVFNNTTGGATSFAATLTVTPPGVAPQVTLEPVNQEVTEGQNVQFTAEASGTPAPTVQWQKNSGGSWSDISGATTTTLSFKALLANSGTQYRAVFTNVLGSATSTAAILTVNPIPKYQVSVSANNSAWGTAFGSGAYAAGENVVLSGVANLGFSFVSWQEGGAEVSTSATYRFKMGTADRTLTAIFQPSWPSNVRLSGTALSTSSVRISLNRAVQNADSYVIHYGSEIITKPAANGITWTIDGLTKATTYTFTVQAIYNGWPETTNGPSVRLKTKNK